MTTEPEIRVARQNSPLAKFKVPQIAALLRELIYEGVAQ